MTTSSAVVGSSAITSDGLAGERERDHHPLALAAGELVRVAPRRRPAVSPTVVEQLADPLAPPRFAAGRARAGGSPPRSGRRPAAPGRASSSRPGRPARRGASARAACPRSVRRPMLIGSSTPGGRRVIVPACVERRRQQLHQRQRGGRLAAARLARQPERLARARASRSTPSTIGVAADGRPAGR